MPKRNDKAAAKKYAAFLETKKPKPIRSDIADYDIPDYLFDFQKEILRRAVDAGRYAVFADCGLGKTPMQLAWAEIVRKHTDKPILIFAPLAVSTQTAREGDKFGIEVNIAREQSDIKRGINITNYEMIHHFDPEGLGGVVLDESSILKNLQGKIRRRLTEFVTDIGFRLAATATPAPNDITEVTNHAEFLNIMRSKECMALFFRQDGNSSNVWRLKGHAIKDFYQWMNTWGVAARDPGDLGFDDDRFVLPELNYSEHIVDGQIHGETLFPVEALSLSDRIKARAKSIPERVAICADIVNESTEPFVCWCGLNAESDALVKAIPGAVGIKGADNPNGKVAALEAFAAGDRRVIVTKPSIAGHGLNWQHCHNMAFVGLSDSWEQYYQAVRRCWRFGQENPVDVHIVVSENEGAVLTNILRKESNARAMIDQMVGAMNVEYSSRLHGGGKAEKERMPSWL